MTLLTMAIYKLSDDAFEVLRSRGGLGRQEKLRLGQLRQIEEHGQRR